jgi:hypothetical protein
MRNLFSILLISAGLVRGYTADIGQNPSVTIADEKLFLAYVEGSTNTDVLLNEYIRKDESLENWKILFAVRYVTAAKSVEEVVGRWKAYLSQAKSPGQTLREDEGSTPADRRFSLAIRAPGDAYVENDQMRFVPGPNGKGVIYYQAAIRVKAFQEAEVRQGIAKQTAFTKALKTITVQPVEKMAK